MNINESDVTVEVLDGEELLIPNREAWSQLLAGDMFRGKAAFSEGLKELTEYHVHLADRYPEFVVSLRDFRVFPRFYSPCMLFKTNLGLQRVHIEHLTCEVCRWYGATANPMIVDLYAGVTNWLEVMRSAERHPVLPCPRCGSKLPRHPIWTEPDK